jgi:hypothetical protein
VNNWCWTLRAELLASGPREKAAVVEWSEVRVQVSIAGTEICSGERAGAYIRALCQEWTKHIAYLRPRDARARYLDRRRTGIRHLGTIQIILRFENLSLDSLEDLMIDRFDCSHLKRLEQVLTYARS